MTLHHRILHLCALLLLIVWGAALGSCNRDGVIEAGAKPTITLDNPTGVYYILTGEQLVISPTYTNTEGASYLWSEDGETIATTPTLRSVWSEAGTYYLTLTVTNTGGSATEEMRVEVSEPVSPAISLPLKGDELMLLRGSSYTFAPDIKGVETPGFDLEWVLDGAEAGHDMTYTFNADNDGDYTLEIKASNDYGSCSRTIRITVAATLPFTLKFPAVSPLNPSTTRYTFPNRGVFLTPATANLGERKLSWAVDGVSSGHTGPSFLFTPTSPGVYTVTASAGEGESASVEVVCTAATEASRCRHSGVGSSPDFSHIYEWMPAPGQFIGDPQTQWSETDALDATTATAYATRRLRDGGFVSLGGFGGYLVAGFDHSVMAGSTGYDFAIGGNAFRGSDNARGSNEPGVVYVMQDVNGNGQPDDEWYELRGSARESGSAVAGYSVTYYRPGAPEMKVLWSDCLGNTGSIDYLPTFHGQPSYYPSWLPGDCYTLTGTCLLPPDATAWTNIALNWGYADNLGSDTLSEGNGSEGGEGQTVGFSISNAIYPDGTPVKLQYIDFVKIQTGVNAKSTILGEVSTEIFSIKDLSLSRK